MEHHAPIPQDVLLAQTEFVLNVTVLNTRFTILLLPDAPVLMDISNTILLFPQILLVPLVLWDALDAQIKELVPNVILA